MGYLNNSTINIDAILTNKGREILASNPQNFIITQFALGDDEIDYTLWNEDHSLGSNYYGIAIENLPLLEAIPRETDMLRYKLITMPRNTRYIPSIQLGTSTVTLDAGNTWDITPNVINDNYGGANSTLGYTATISDNSVCSIVVTEMVATTTGGKSVVSSYDDISTQSVTVVGKSFRIIAKSLATAATCKLSIVGNETGGFGQITITVNRDQSINWSPSAGAQ